MICDQLTSLLGFDCSPITESGDVVLISTPFRFDDGDALPVFAESVNGQIRFFDDGQALLHFMGRGIRIENRKHASFLTSAASKNGATFSDQGEIEVWAPMKEAAAGFAKYLSSMIALSSWERDERGASTDASLFVAEVAMALRAWKPQADITVEPAFEGVSGRTYKLEFLFDGQAVAVTGSHPNSVSALLHKLVDIHGRIANADTRFLVVIDDRSDPEAATRESLVVQSVAKVIPLTKLESAAQRSATAH